MAIVVTGVLAALIVSAYRTHAVRAQVTEGIELAAAWRGVVENAFERSGQVPANWEAAGAGPQSPESPNVASVRLVDGRLDVIFGEDADRAIAGRRLSLTPYETASQEIVWICGNAIPPRGLEPLGFAGGGGQSVQEAATVDARYLSSACR